MYSILVVDDELEILNLIELYLKSKNYIVYKLHNPKDTMKFLSEHKVDLAILDIMMPDIDGFSLCAKIRENYNFPIMFLTAKIDEVDKIKGLTLGADDYIEKPFRALELLARIESQLRRYKVYSKEPNSDNKIFFGDIEIDNAKHEMLLCGNIVELTPTEFAIVWNLCKSRGEVVSNDELFKRVWNDKYYENDNNTVMVHIRHIREKLSKINSQKEYIITIWGVGYAIKQ